MDGAFRSGPGNDSLIPDLISSVHVLPGGKIKPGAELLLDYDYQPGALGHHDYDLFAGLPDHLPWPPPNSSAALKPMHLTPSPTPSRGSTSRRLSRGGHRRRTMAKVGATAETAVPIATLAEPAILPLASVQRVAPSGVLRDSLPG